VAYYDVKVPYIIFSEFSEIYSIQYKPIFLKVENIRTVLLPTVSGVPPLILMREGLGMAPSCGCVVVVVEKMTGMEIQPII
jgi:hypothetical protein